MAVRIVMPKLGMVMAEGTVTRWAKSAGDQVAQGEVIAEIDTEKVNYEMEATDGGIFHPIVPEGAIVAVDGLLGYLLAEGEAAPEPEVEPAPTPAPIPIARGPRPARAPASVDVVPSTPGARRLAASLGVDLSKVTPSGPRGRIVEADVRGYDAQTGAGSTVPPGLPPASTVVPMRGMRKAIADHMRSSISTSAQLSYFLEVDVTEAQRLRQKVSKDAGQNIALAHALIKACAEALTRVPELNSVLADGSILYFDQVSMGVAVALDDGLIVPVLREVEKKDIFQIAEETGELAAKAREGRLMPDDLAGGTFTISVLGSVDGFTPILNQGQSAIMGIGRSVEKPVVKNGEIIVRDIMTVSLTADHQVVDGAVAAGFLRRFQQIIERPARLFKSDGPTGD